METVAVIGASPKPDRYSNMAFQLLQEYGHKAIPVTSYAETIEGIDAYKHIDEIPEQIDTVTLYLHPLRLGPVIPEIIRKKPARVIFNPGTEAPELEQQLEDNGIKALRACTLVMLKTGQF